jgi:hypothetical protein
MRRTSSIDVTFPEGRNGPMRLVARARDALAAGSGANATTIAEGAFEALLKPDRSIISITAQPDRPALKDMAGERAGGHLRNVIDLLLPNERLAGTPLHLILDDMSGVSLIAPWACSRWEPNWREEMARMKAEPANALLFEKENICTGLRTGSSAHEGAFPEGADTGDLRNPEDPDGWHAMPNEKVPSLRRARRIDVTLKDGLIRIDSAFQDSATTPDGPRSVIHEYRLRAAADPETLELVMLDAEPRVLPFAECPEAAAKAQVLVGTKLPMLRQAVLEKLRGTAGCTHLNDALRALAEVPILVGHMQSGRGVAAGG